MTTTRQKSGTPPSADERTILAYERTYTAWVRTGLTALGGGIGIRALLGRELPNWMVEITSTSLVLLSVFMFSAGIWCDRSSRLNTASSIRAVPQWLLRPMNASLVIVALLSLLGMWM